MLTYKHLLLANNCSPIQRLAWPLAISLIVHACVLSQLDWKVSHTPGSDQHPLTVNFAPLPSVRRDKMDQEKILSPAHAVHNRFSGNKRNSKNEISKPAEMSTMVVAVETANPLNTEELLKQAEEQAKKEYRTSAPVLFPHGDYYGSYTGSDEGTFFFHLDNSGHASGSGQSGKFGVNFFIHGSTTTDGVIQMTGSGMAGDARFTGQLEIRTGKVSGSWMLAGFGGGSFSGQRE